MKCVAAVDRDAHAIATFRSNLPDVEHVLERDLTTFAPEELRKEIGPVEVHAIIERR